MSVLSKFKKKWILASPKNWALILLFYAFPNIVYAQHIDQQKIDKWCSDYRLPGYDFHKIELTHPVVSSAFLRVREDLIPRKFGFVKRSSEEIYGGKKKQLLLEIELSDLGFLDAKLGTEVANILVFVFRTQSGDLATSLRMRSYKDFTEETDSSFGITQYSIPEYVELPLPRSYYPEIYYFSGDAKSNSSLIKCIEYTKSITRCRVTHSTEFGIGYEIEFKKELMPYWSLVVEAMNRLLRCMI